MAKGRRHWYGFHVDRSTLRELADEMGCHEYSEERGHGFLLEERRPTHLLGRHVERTERKFRSVDPFGVEASHSVTVYVSTGFRVCTRGPGLELLAPPRSVRMFVSQLAGLLDFEVPVTGLVVDPLVWLAALENDGWSTSASQVEFRGILFRGGTKGTLRLSGVDDVRAAGRSILGKRRHTPHSVTAEVQGEVTAHVTLRRDAGASIVATDLCETLPAIRSALATALISTDSG